MLSVNVAIILIEILLDIIMFNILYSTINSDKGYIKNVLIYAGSMMIKIIVGTGIIFYYPLAIFVFWYIFLAGFAIFFIIGLVLIYLLYKYSYVEKLTFIITGMLMQFGIISLLNLFIY